MNPNVNQWSLPELRREEIVSLQLRSLFEKAKYQLYRMSSFEEYDFYLQNRPFMTGEDVITFTGSDGRLMALKPDVTLSIIKNTPAGENRRIYYNEQVFRRSRHSGEYREIRQMGLECIGDDQVQAEQEVVPLALQSLAIVGDSVLDLSHMDFVECILALFTSPEGKQGALQALRDKSPHTMEQMARQQGLPKELSQKVAQLSGLSGPFSQTIDRAKELSREIPGAQKALQELEELYAAVCNGYENVAIRLDFSIVNDSEYYNGIVFKGFAKGVPAPVLSGGRYDRLMHRFGKNQGAVGFALYLDEAEQAEAVRNGSGQENQESSWLNIALPKGRMGTKIFRLLQEIGVSSTDIAKESRKLVFEDEENKVRFFLVKPTDVDVYVEHGAADIGVVGKDTLLENGSDVMELLDLGFGKCRLAVCAVNGFVENTTRPLRVATKYENIARNYYAQKSRAVEMIKLHGSIELAPLIDLSDVIVDIVETGATLQENNMGVMEEIVDSSARLIANRASWRFKEDRIRQLTSQLGEKI